MSLGGLELLFAVVVGLPAAAGALWKAARWFAKVVQALEVFAKVAPRLTDVVDQFEPNGRTIPERLKSIEERLSIDA